MSQCLSFANTRSTEEGLNKEKIAPRSPVGKVVVRDQTFLSIESSG